MTPEDALAELRREYKELTPALVQAASKASKILLGGIRRHLRATKIPGLLVSWQDAPGEVTQDGRIRAVVFSNHPAAGMREWGAKILPGKNAAKSGPNAGQPTKALAIPLDVTEVAKVSRGGPVTKGALRFFPKKKQTANGQMVGLLFPKSQPNADPVFILMSEVNVPAYPYIMPAIEENSDRIGNVFRDAIVTVLQKGKS